VKETGREHKSVSIKYGVPDFCEPVRDSRTRLEATPSVSRRINEYYSPHDRDREVHLDPMLNCHWEEHRNVPEFQPQGCSSLCVIDASERILPRPVITKFDGNLMNFRTFERQFEAYIIKKAQSDEMRLLFLLQHCKPQVRQRIEHFTSKDPSDGYRLAWNTLLHEYSQPHVIAKCCEQQLKEVADVRANDPDGLLELSVLMDKCHKSLKKLPVQMREKWVETSTSIECETGRTANFAALSDFVAKQSQLANSIFGRALNRALSSRQPAYSKHVTVAAHNVVTTSESPKEAKITVGNNNDALVCACWSKLHRLYKCQRFIAMNSCDRYKLVRSKNLCYRCLSGGHQIKDCIDEKGVCTVEGCDKLHHRLLHFTESRDKNPSKENDPNVVSSVVDTNVARPKVSGLSIYLKVVPVVVNHGEKRITPYAFLDPGSSVSFCEKKLVDKLGAVGSPKSINVQTLTGPQCSTLLPFKYLLSQ